MFPLLFFNFFQFFWCVGKSSCGSKEVRKEGGKKKNEGLKERLRDKQHNTQLGLRGASRHQRKGRNDDGAEGEGGSLRGNKNKGGKELRIGKLGWRWDGV